MIAISYLGNNPKSSAPIKATIKAKSITNLPPNFSVITPAGIDIKPQATKNAKGRNETKVKLKLKELIISGMSGPMIFVKKEMTKKVNKTRPTMKQYFFTLEV